MVYRPSEDLSTELCGPLCVNNRIRDNARRTVMTSIGNRKLVMVTALGLLAAPVFANESTPGNELAQARATCHADEVALSQVEHSTNSCSDDPKVIQARDTAEHSCGRAMKLMITAGLEPK